MRKLVTGFAAIAAALALVACGDDDRPGGGVDAGRDSGPAIDSGPLPDTGPVPDTGSPPDTGGPTGMCPAGDCDLLTNGCPAGQACYFLASAMGEPARPVCQMSGTGGDGATCATYMDCQEGFFCDNGAGVCRHYCCMGSDTGCPTGQTCAVQIVDDMGMDTGVGYCALPDNCDPAEQTGCSGDNACYGFDDGSTRCIGSLMDLAEGSTCGAANDCVGGTQCFSVGDGGPVCHKFCNSMTMMGCAGEQTCSPLGWPAPLDHLGLCTPAAT